MDREASSSEFWSYFKRSEWVFFCLLIATGLLLRWIGLSDRPLHHDESIHVMFGRYFFDWPDQQFYKYNPEYHGPLLYTVLRLIYSTFGDTEWSARFLIDIMGSGFLFVPFLFRKFLSPTSVLSLTLMISLSPTMVFWSRFVREDFFVVTGMLMILYGVLLASSRLRALWILLGLLLQWSSKENTFVTLALLYGYAVFEYVMGPILLKRQREPFPLTLIAPLVFAFGVLLEFTWHTPHAMDFGAIAVALLIIVDTQRSCWTRDRKNSLSRLYGYVSWHKTETFAAFLVTAYLFCFLFGAGWRASLFDANGNYASIWRYPEGILDGLYRKGITFWLEKHNMERINGPFAFHLYQLSWYEFVFMLAFVSHLVLFFLRSTFGEKLVQGAMYSLSLACCVYFLWFPTAGYTGVWELFKAKNAVDVAAVVVLFVYPFLITIHHFKRDEGALAFFGYLFSASLFSYSYLGEKVPWLSTYPLIAGYAYFALFYEEIFRERWRDFTGRLSWSRVFVASGYTLLILGILFSLQEKISANVPYLVAGLLFVSIGYLDEKYIKLGEFRVRTALFLAVFLFNFRATILANYNSKFREFGYMSQVHTTRELVRVAHRVRSEIESWNGGTKPKVLVVGDAVWPLTWYFRDLPEYKFSASDEEKKDFTYIFQDYDESGANVPPGFKVVKLNLRGWWVPEFEKMTFKNFLNYSINQNPWSGVGFTYVTFLTKEEGSH